MIYNKPQMMAKVGMPTPQAVIYKSESHKLHQAFPVNPGKTIIQGMPVKLNEDGTIEMYAGEGVYLGIAVTDSKFPAYPGDEVTVMMEGFAVVYGLSNGEIKASYVIPDKTANPAEDSQYIKYNQQATDSPFIALNTATAAGELIQILVK